MKIISTAPTRVSLFGGGTDVTPYSNQQGGLCLNMAINLRQTIYWEQPTSSSFFKIPMNGSIDFYRSFFESYNIPFSISYFENSFDGQIEGGLGSSASCAVALIAAIGKYKKLKLTKDEIAEKAWDIEVNKLGLFGGKQDQYSASYGGVNLMEFSEEGVKVTQLGPSFIEPILPYLMLFNTGIKRKDKKIQEGMKTLTLARKEALDKIKELTKDACVAITNKDAKMVGKLLDISWELKKKSNNVTNDKIDAIFKRSKKLGSWGGKLLGSGGGGYCIFMVPLDKQEMFKKKIGIDWVDFDISWDGVQTRII